MQTVALSHRPTLVRFGWLALLTLGITARADQGPNPVSPFFRASEPHRVDITIPADGLQSLRADHREYVRATVRADAESFQDVAVRVKGRIGSLRPIDDKPSLTLDLDRFVAGQQLGGCSKLHLNNSVEDPSYLHEKLGTEVFWAAGIPAPPVTHAMVTLNGRPLGLYVVKEGFATEFLGRYFPGDPGDLFEPEAGPGCDVEGPMKLNLGHETTARPELRTLAEAVAEPDLARRWMRSASVLDRNRFMDFLALETFLVHRDGYGLARNNYRLYRDRASSRFLFLPSGMDRLLVRPDAGLFPRFSGTVARALMETPEGFVAYRQHLGTLVATMLAETAWTNRIQEWAAAVVPALNRREAAAFRRETADLTQRWLARLESVRRQLAQPEKSPLAFQGDVARPMGWHPNDLPDGGRLEETIWEGRRTLSIAAGPRTSASWRTRVFLEPGRYRIEARARGRGIVALPFGRNHGATLAIDGRTPSGVKALLGDTEWTPLAAEFEVPNAAADVELSLTLRARAGQVWFDVDSLKLVWLGGR